MDVEHGVPPPDYLQDARTAVISFLRAHRTEEVVPENSRVVVIDSSVRLVHAFRSLLDNGIRAAPIVDPRTLAFVGMLTVSDIIDSLCHFYHTDGDVTRGLEEHTIESWRAISKSPDVHAGFRFVDAEATLHDACLILRDHRIHRLPILHDKSLLLCTLEHWRVLRFVHQHLAGHERQNHVAQHGQQPQHQQHLHFQMPQHQYHHHQQHQQHLQQQHQQIHNQLEQHQFQQQQQLHQQHPSLTPPLAHMLHPALPPTADLFSLTLAQLGIGSYQTMITVRETDNLLHVLETMRGHSLSAVPVVDASGRLTNVYSRTDITVLSRAGAGTVDLEQTVLDALAPAREPDFRVVTCRRSDSLRVIFERFETTRKHRLYAVSDEGTVEGVLSLSDLLAYFLG
jgi:CBS domain-containing protein